MRMRIENCGIMIMKLHRACWIRYDPCISLKLLAVEMVNRIACAF